MGIHDSSISISFLSISHQHKFRDPSSQQRLFDPQNKGEESVAREVQQCYPTPSSAQFMKITMYDRKAFNLKINKLH